MNRKKMIFELEGNDKIWDFIIIGGGATGLGAAIEASSRGYKTLLLEQYDFGKGTSSRSTKLIHGGVRYLQQGKLSLVLSSLKERGLLLQNAPYLVHKMAFIVPVYNLWSKIYYGIGLKLYDILAGKNSIGSSKILSKIEVIEKLPTIESKKLKGGILYYDCQFDDARMLINMAQTAVEQGAIVLNYFQVFDILKENGKTSGVKVKDWETGKEYILKAKAVINSTGVFSDALRIIDNSDNKKMIYASQGTHLVLSKSFLPGNSALMVPKTDDGRILFIIPWYNTVIIGTTDILVEDHPIEPIPLKEEIDFLIEHAKKYLNKKPTANDVLSIFSGLRPLVHSGKDKNTSKISRDHTILISQSGLITIAGGKWTTFRKMGEDVINKAVQFHNMDAKPSVSKNLKIHGWNSSTINNEFYKKYGSDAVKITEFIKKNEGYSEIINDEFNICKGEIIWCIRNEMACKIEDFLARRTGLLFQNAKVCMEIAPEVAEIMAIELNKKEKWINEQIEQFSKIANQYLVI